MENNKNFVPPNKTKQFIVGCLCCLLIGIIAAAIIFGLFGLLYSIGNATGLTWLVMIPIIIVFTLLSGGNEGIIKSAVKKALRENREEEQQDDD